MAYLDYFNPEAEEEKPGEPAGTSAPAPSGPVSAATPGAGSATGAPDRPQATALPDPSGNPAQNGTGFVGISQYFSPNAETAQRQTGDYLGGLDVDSTAQARQPGGIIGSLQAKGDPTYSAGMAGLDAYLMGRSGSEDAIRGLTDYFEPAPRPRPETPPSERPRKPIYDPEMDDRWRRPERGGY